MTYVLFVYDRPDALAHLSAAEQQAVYREYEALGSVPGLSGYRLGPPDGAATAQPDGMVLAGFYVLETDERERAADVAARIPAARLGGTVELRPVAGES